jgi:hypothetical protein
MQGTPGAVVSSLQPAIHCPVNFLRGGVFQGERKARLADDQRDRGPGHIKLARLARVRR